MLGAVSQGFNVWANDDGEGQNPRTSAGDPAISRRRPSGADLRFMQELLAGLEGARVPAPAPIEQRWSASSSAPMSPAAARGAPDTLHSWVGIIMYMPTSDPAQRAAITDKCARFRFFASELPGVWGRLL
jgi:hypothetical protein